MDPAIRFCRCPDGATLAYASAYASLGDAAPDRPTLVITPSTWDTMELRFQTSDQRFWDTLAAHFNVCTYDRRGTGLSDHDRDDFSPALDAADLAALGDQLGPAPFDLFAAFQLVPAAIRFAVDHPERLRHLILWGAFTRGQEIAAPDTRDSLITMARGAQGLAFRTLADMAHPGIDQELRERIVRIGRAGIEGEAIAGFLQALYDADVSDLLPRLRVPTLVLHRQQDRAVAFALGRAASAAIPNARFTALQGDIHWPWMGDIDQVLQAVYGFLAPGVPVPTPSPTASTAPSAPPPRQPELRTVLFTDVEGSTELTDRFGDEPARDILRRHEEITRAALSAHGGTEVKTMGDGFMASFSSVSQAIDAAIDMQRTIEAELGGGARPVRIRVGINAGEPIAEADDLFGTAVIQAARAMAEAAGGEILCTNVVRELARGRPYRFAGRGPVSLRGFDEPIQLFEIAWRDPA